MSARPRLDDETINRLRSYATDCLDRLDEIVPDPIARRKTRAVLRGFMSLYPHPRYTPRLIAKFVDQKINILVRVDGWAEEDAIIAARKEAVKITGRTADAVKKAHLRYGRRGVTKGR